MHPYRCTHCCHCCEDANHVAFFKLFVTITELTRDERRNEQKKTENSPFFIFYCLGFLVKRSNGQTVKRSNGQVKCAGCMSSALQDHPQCTLYIYINYHCHPQPTASTSWHQSSSIHPNQSSQSIIIFIIYII